MSTREGDGNCSEDNVVITTAETKIEICYTVPLETMGPFAAILPRSNRGFYLQFHLGKTPSNRTEKLGFT